jgi:hypothetical protein
MPKKTMMIVTITLLFMASACSGGVYPSTPITTKADIRASGMYAYFLNDSELQNRSLSMEIVPFQVNCSLLNEGVFQPLFINYNDASNNRVLAIRISQDDAFVPPTEPDGFIEVDNDWEPNGRLEYRQRTNTQVFFEDDNGLDIVFESPSLSIDDMEKLIGSVERIGQTESPIIPWTDSCN